MGRASYGRGAGELGLARGRTVIRYDRLGTGMSERRRRRDQMNLDVETATVRAVLDEVGVERCDVLGFSCGGPIGVAFAAGEPDRVRRMVFLGSYATARSSARSRCASRCSRWCARTGASARA